MNDSPHPGAPRHAPTPPERRTAPVASEHPSPETVGVVGVLRQLEAEDDDLKIARILREHVERDRG